MELAIINGTYRTASSNSTTQNGQSQAFAAAAAVAAATAAAAGKQNPLLSEYLNLKFSKNQIKILFK